MSLRRITPSVADPREPLASYPVAEWVNSLLFTSSNDLVVATHSGVHRMDLERGELKALWTHGQSRGLTASGDEIRFVGNGHIIRCTLDGRSCEAREITFAHSRRSAKHPVSAAAFSPSGQRLALAAGYTDRDEGGVVHWLSLIDAATGKELRCLYDGLNIGPEARWLRFGASGQRLYQCTAKDVTVWDLDAGTAVRSVGIEPLELIGAAAFHSDGRRVATCLMSGGRLRVIDMETGECLSDCAHPHGQTLAMAWTPQDMLVLSAGRDVWLYDPSKGPVHRVLVGRGSEITAIVERPGSGTFLAASRSTCIAEHTLASNERPGRTGHDGAVRALVVAARRAISAGDDDRVFVWDLASGQAQGGARVHAPICAAASLGGKLFFGHHDGAVTRRDAETLELLWCSEDPGRAGTSRREETEVKALFAVSGDRVISLAMDAVCVRDATTGELLEEIRGCSIFRWAGVAEGEKELLLKGYGPDRFVPLGRGDARSEDLRTISKILDSDPGVSELVRLRSRGQLSVPLALGQEQLRWFDPRTGEPTRVVDLRMSRAMSVPCRLAVSLSGRFVAVTGGDTWRAWLIDADTGGLSGELDLPAAATACAVSDEGRLVIGDARGDVVVLAGPAGR